MYHSINIGNKNTWTDWHLIPASRPVVAPPEPDFNYFEIPGTDGVVDLTETIAGRVTYRNRTGSWEFIVDNDHEPWDVIYTNILNYLHGRRFSIILEDEPNYTYEGRLSLNEWRSDPDYSRIVIEYNINPYKEETFGHGYDDWLWDPFDFVTGYIDDSRINVPAGSTINYKLNVINKPVTPTFYAYQNAVKIKIGSTTYDVPKNKDTTFESISLKQGENNIRIQSIFSSSEVTQQEWFDTYMDKLLTDLKSAMANTLSYMEAESIFYRDEIYRIKALYVNLESCKLTLTIPNTVRNEFYETIGKYLKAQIAGDLSNTMKILINDLLTATGSADLTIKYKNGAL